MTDDLTSEDEKLLFTREELASDIALILKGDAHSPEALAHLFIILREAIMGGLEGINRTRETLAAAVELTFTHSRAHTTALRLYLLSVEGHLRAEDEPVRLLKAAVGRGAAKEIGRAHV